MNTTATIGSLTNGSSFPGSQTSGLLVLKRMSLAAEANAVWYGCSL